MSDDASAASSPAGDSSPERNPFSEDRTETDASVTQLLDELSPDDPEVAEDLLPLIYDRLHRLARQQRRGWQSETMNTTALVHEAYIKLVDQKDPGWENRAHFFGVAAKAMRHILVDYARRKNAQKRGGDQERVPLTVASPSTEQRATDVLSLDRALRRLEEISPRQGRVVECRFFAGMTIDETATALGISPSTVGRDWTAARAWLYRAMKEEDE